MKAIGNESFRALPDQSADGKNGIKLKGTVYYDKSPDQ
jgi:hypothetical protein